VVTYCSYARTTCTLISIKLKIIFLFLPSKQISKRSRNLSPSLSRCSSYQKDVVGRLVDWYRLQRSMKAQYILPHRSPRFARFDPPTNEDRQQPQSSTLTFRRVVIRIDSKRLWMELNLEAARMKLPAQITSQRLLSQGYEIVIHL